MITEKYKILQSLAKKYSHNCPNHQEAATAIKMVKTGEGYCFKACCGICGKWSAGNVERPINLYIKRMIGYDNMTDGDKRELSKLTYKRIEAIQKGYYGRAYERQW